MRDIIICVNGGWSTVWKFFNMWKINLCWEETEVQEFITLCIIGSEGCQSRDKGQFKRERKWKQWQEADNCQLTKADKETSEKISGWVIKVLGEILI